MKKVIDGHMYNTDTAKELGFFNNGNDYSNLYYFEETLFRTKSGLYFLYGEGGAGSRYCEVNGDEYSYGSRIIPLDESEARKWAERHLDGDTYEEIFGSSDGGATGVLLNVPDPLLARVDAACSAAGKTRTDFILDALRKALK